MWWSISSPHPDRLMSALFCVNGLQLDYLKMKQLGGAAVWTLDMDDFSGRFCGRGKYPVISHLRRKLIQGDVSACSVLI